MLIAVYDNPAVTYSAGLSLNYYYNLSYDPEGHLATVSGPSTNAAFIYDGDGKMVKANINNITTLYVSAAYQVKGNLVTKYYPGGAFRVGGTLYYALTDHLGSTSITIDPAGNKIETRYKAWGEVRYTNDTSSSALTDKTFTGQRSYVGDFGLMYYNARWYDSSIGRFAQADTLVPNNIQGLDHYAYGNNNPIKYTDPSGHDACSSVPLGYREGCYRSIGYRDAANAVVQQITNLIIAIAKEYNIHLSPNDHWQYTNGLYQYQKNEDGTLGGLVPGGGYTPRYENDPGWYDKNGNPFVAEDTAVYIGNRAFILCNDNTECVAEIMAHEAVHSQIEYLLDPQNSNSQDVKDFTSPDKLHYEEVFAIITIRDSRRFGTAGADMGQQMYDVECARDSCNDSQVTSWLAGGYNISLSANMMLHLVFPNSRESASK